MTLPLRQNIRKAQERYSWRKTVLSRLESCNDLVAEEDIYHSLCMAELCVMPKATNKKGRLADPRYHQCN